MKGRKKRQKLKHLYLIWCNSLEAVFSLWSVELIHCVARATKMKNDIQDKKGAKKVHFTFYLEKWSGMCVISHDIQNSGSFYYRFSLSRSFCFVSFFWLWRWFSAYALNCSAWTCVHDILLLIILLLLWSSLFLLLMPLNWSDQIIVSCPLARISLFIDWHLFAWARLFRLLVKYTHTVSLSVYSLHLDWFIECLLWFI